MADREEFVNQAIEAFEANADSEELSRIAALFEEARHEFDRLFGSPEAIDGLQPDDFFEFFNLIDAHRARKGRGIFRFNLPFPKNPSTLNHQRLEEDIGALRDALKTLLHDSPPLEERIDKVLAGPRPRTYVTDTLAVPSVLLSFSDPASHAGVQKMDRKREKLRATGDLPQLPKNHSMGEEFVALEEALASFPARHGRDWDWATRFSFYFSDEFSRILEVGDVTNGDAEQSKLIEEVARQVYKDLIRHINVLIYGPPGTGKTRLMQRVVEIFESESVSSESGDYQVVTDDEQQPIVAGSTGGARVGWATFHQSYSYEEFIVGLRPDPESEKMLSLTPVPGMLLELAEFARIPGNSSLLVIDEINRGNVSRIFGEFITLLEPDKRLNDLGEQTPTTVSVTLPYMKSGSSVTLKIGDADVTIANPFTMPRPLYTLASMNSVDKSVAPLDSALRRRFHVKYLEPDLGLIARHMGIEGDLEFAQLRLPDPLENVDQVRLLGLAVLNNLNHGIASFLGEEFRLGHWYLRELADALESVDVALYRLAEIWEFSLLPQLEELFHGRVDQLKVVLRSGAFTGASPVRIIDPEEALAELGAVPYIKHERGETPDVIRFLRNVAAVGVQGAPSESNDPTSPPPPEA